MKAVFKLMLFSFVLNLAVGIMTQAIPVVANNPSLNPLSYDEASADAFKTQANKTVSAGGFLEDASSKFDRLLDSIGLGTIQKFLRLVNTFMFGFIQVIEAVFGIDNLWFSGFLRIMIIVGYAFGAIWLWTGKDIGKG